MKCPKCDKELTQLEEFNLYVCSCKCFWTLRELEDIGKVGYQKFCEVEKIVKKKGK